MAMKFHAFKNGMVIMDGNRAVAKARRLGWGEWALHLEGGCWLDAKARRKKLPIPNMPNSGIFDPSRMTAKTRRDAAKILKSLILPTNSPASP